MATPLISVTIPAYKSQYLKKAIESVLGQTYDNWELVIVDDASPEDIFGIVSQYHDTRIQYFRNKENCGAINVVDNWNKCLSLAKGDFVICMGDDDLLPSNALSLYSEKIERYPDVDVFHARTIIVDEDDNPISIVSDRAEHETVYSFVRHRIEGTMQFIGDFCIRRQRLQEIGGYIKFPLAWGSDDITVFEAAKDYGVVNLREPSFCYRCSSITISRTVNTFHKLNAISQEKEWYRSFIKNGDSITNEIDRLDCLYIKNHYNNKIDVKRSKCIAEDMRGNIFRWIKWWWLKKNLQLSNAAMFLAIYEYVKGKYLSKKNQNIAYS